MTAVFSWLEAEDKAAWIVADTRIRNPERNLTDSGAKILPLSIRCREPNSKGAFAKVTFATTVGFAYAGSTLPALMTYVLANTLFQELCGMPGTPRISVFDIGKSVTKIANRYYQETFASFEILILGWCSRLNRFACYSVRPNKNSAPYDMQLIEETLYNTNGVVKMGSNSPLIDTYLCKASEQTAEQQLKRFPQLALRNLIRDGVINTVGGDMQLGRAHESGFRLLSHARPISKNDNRYARYMLGVDLEMEIGSVGAFQPLYPGTI